MMLVSASKFSPEAKQQVLTGSSGLQHFHHDLADLARWTLLSLRPQLQRMFTDKL